MNKPDEKETGNAGTQGGHRPRPKGRAVVGGDEQIDGVPIPGLGELAFLWGADEPATYPNAGTIRQRGVPVTLAAFIIGAHRR